MLAGDPANERAEARGNVRGDIFGCPDGLMLDARGLLWTQTDAHATQMYQGEFRNIGNDPMLACDLRTGEIRRFLTGPGGSSRPRSATVVIHRADGGPIGSGAPGTPRPARPQLPESPQRQVEGERRSVAV